LVAAAAAGCSLADVARAAGLSQSTAQRRLRDPEVAAEIRRMRDDVMNAAVGKLVALNHRALARLEALVDDESPHVALRAVDIVLNGSLKFRAACDLSERIAALEAADDPAESPMQAGASQGGTADLRPVEAA
jgi:AcrR family transcriptional regulator